MKTLTLISAFFLLTTLSYSQQKVITVDNRENSGADYTSLSSAIDAAIAGDTIQIYPSPTSYGSKTFQKRLVIVGTGHNPDNTPEAERPTVATLTLGAGTSNTEILGISVSNINVINGSNTTDVRVVNNWIYGAGVTGNAGSNNWIVEGNVFVTASANVAGSNGWLVKNNIFDNASQYPMVNFDNTNSFLNNLVWTSNGNFANACTDPIVNNNVIILQGSVTAVNLNNSTVTFNNNLTYNVNGSPVDALSGSNNLDSTNPQFVSAPFGSIDDIYNNDYNVGGSAVNAGTDGTDLGIFGANFNFDNNGRPDDFPYMTSLSISNSSVPMGDNLNVTFSAEKKN